MGNQLPALEKLFDQWTEKHAQGLSMEPPYSMPHEPPYGGFVRDGVINFDKWKKQKVRICFLLNEAGGYTDLSAFPNGHDVADEWNKKGSFTKFMFKLAIWVQAINDAFIPPVTYVKKEIKAIKDDLIRSIALVNIKKSDGQVQPDYAIIKNFANVDADEIRKELEIIKANIIICCGNMFSLWGKRPAEGEENPKKWVFYKDELIRVSKFAYAWDKKLVLSLWTPAQFHGHLSSNTITYYAVREILRAALKALNTKPAPTPANSATATAPAAKPPTPAPAEAKPPAPAPAAKPVAPAPVEAKPPAPAPAAKPVAPVEVKPAESVEVKPAESVEVKPAEVAPVEEVAEKPKRGRKKKVAETAEDSAPAETATAEEAAEKPKRGRKKKVDETAETATAEEVTEKPKRGRKKKVDDAETPAESSGE